MIEMKSDRSTGLVARLVMFCLFMLAAAMGTQPAWAQGVTLVEAGKDPARIVTLGFEDQPPRDRQMVLRVLPPYLKKMAGVDFPVSSVKAGSELPAPAIVFQLAPVLDAQGKPLPDDAFSIQTRDGRLWFTSASRVGLHYAFYHWMESLGARFWSYDDEVIPTLPTIQVPPTDYTWNPPFRIHDIMSKEAQTGANDFRDKSRNASNLKFTGGHTLYKLLTPYAKEHPDIYPLVQTIDKKTKQVTKEERKANNLHFCYSNPDIAQALADALEEQEIKKRGGNVKDFIYFAGMGDWYGGACACDRCKAIYEEEKWTWETDAEGKPRQTNGYSGSLLRMINRTAEILEAKYPGIQVGTFAYMSFEMPPAVTKPRDNVVIYMPRLRHCSVHGVDECTANHAYWVGLQQWCKLAPGRTYVWEYGTSFNNFLIPFPSLRAMANNIKAYHRIGVAGMDIQANYVTYGGHQVVMNNWVWSKLMNDPSQATEALIRQFTDEYYGPAAAAVRQYDALLEKSTREPALLHANEFAVARKSFLTDEVLASLEAQIAEARRQAPADGDADFHRRVEELAVGVDATRMWSAGPLEERDGRLIRTDLGADTFERAKAMYTHSRKATPREWGNGRAYWMEMISWHGGPVTTLRKGELAARIAPADKGGFGPVTYGDVTAFPKSIMTSLRLGEFIGQPSDSGAATTAEGGIGHWSPDTKHVIEQTFTMPDDHTIRHASRIIQKVSRPADAPPQFMVIRTTLPAKVNSKTLEVAWRDGKGAWHEVKERPEFRKSVDVKGITAWRVRDRGVEFVDEYRSPFLYEKDGQALPMQGKFTHDSTPRTFYLEVHVPLRHLAANEQADWLDRTITFTKLPVAQGKAK